MSEESNDDVLVDEWIRGALGADQVERDEEQGEVRETSFDGGAQREDAPAAPVSMDQLIRDRALGL